MNFPKVARYAVTEASAQAAIVYGARNVSICCHVILASAGGCGAVAVAAWAQQASASQLSEQSRLSQGKTPEHGTKPARVARGSVVLRVVRAFVLCGVEGPCFSLPCSAGRWPIADFRGRSKKRSKTPVRRAGIPFFSKRPFALYCHNSAGAFPVWCTRLGIAMENL